jgi:hypothetical protein
LVIEAKKSYTVRTIFTFIVLISGFALPAQQKGVSPVSNTQAITTGATYAVIIGISDYQDKDIPDLRFADKDAEAFANFLRSPAGGALDGDHLKVLTNQNATAGRIAEALDGLIEQVKEGDQSSSTSPAMGTWRARKYPSRDFCLHGTRLRGFIWAEEPTRSRFCRRWSQP